MIKKLTVEMRNENDRRFAIDHTVDQREMGMLSDQSIAVTLRIGFEEITLPKGELRRLLQAVQSATNAGLEYPEDLKPFYDLEPST